ncbi:hypothetical protein ACSSS7_004424 [Eimeria intestinalis]
MVAGERGVANTDEKEDVHMRTPKVPRALAYVTAHISLPAAAAAGVGPPACCWWPVFVVKRQQCLDPSIGSSFGAVAAVSGQTPRAPYPRGSKETAAPAVGYEDERRKATRPRQACPGGAAEKRYQVFLHWNTRRHSWDLETPRFV